jgi:hypothetical protein
MSAEILLDGWLCPFSGCWILWFPRSQKRDLGQPAFWEGALGAKEDHIAGSPEMNAT